MFLGAQGSDEQLTMDLLEKYMMEKSFIAYIFCLVASITSLFATRDAHKKRYVVIYVLICSMTGSITVMCVKGVSTALILTFQGHNQFIYFVPWMLLGKLAAFNHKSAIFPHAPPHLFSSSSPASSGSTDFVRLAHLSPVACGPSLQPSVPKHPSQGHVSRGLGLVPCVCARASVLPNGLCPKQQSRPWGRFSSR